MTAPENSEVLERLDSIERHLSDRMSRLEVAMMGDEAMGNLGFRGRLEKVELVAAESPSVHTQITNTAREAADTVKENAEEGRKALWTAFRAFQAKVERRWYIQLGAMVGSGGIGAGIYDLIRNSGG